MTVSVVKPLIVGGFGVVAATFLQDTISETIPWLLAMLSVVFCDLVSALRRCAILGEHIRLSKAVRDTMGKAVTYMAFVLMVCMIEVACEKTLHFDKWACLLVCVIELCSIISNILKPHGYDIDFNQLLASLIGTLTGRKGNINGFITKEDKKK